MSSALIAARNTISDVVDTFRSKTLLSPFGILLVLVRIVNKHIALF